MDEPYLTVRIHEHYVPQKFTFIRLQITKICVNYNLDGFHGGIFQNRLILNQYIVDMGTLEPFL